MEKEFYSQKLGGKYLKTRLKSSPTMIVVFALFLAFFFASGVYFCTLGQTRNGVMCFCFMLIIPVFVLLEKLMNMEVSAFFAAFLLLYASGSIMGACYEVYVYVPHFDTILHGMWGVVYVVMGFAIIMQFVGNPKDNKTFFMCLLFGFLFCLAAALVWEIYEYSMFSLSGMDMEEDTIVNYIHSYWLNPDHNHNATYDIFGIAKTVLYDADGNVLYTIEGGYLDIGLIDTLTDMVWCFICGIVFCGIMIADWFLGKRLYKIFIPHYYKNKTCRIVTEAVAEEPALEAATAEADEKEED